jgi:hypothetical protein
MGWDEQKLAGGGPGFDVAVRLLSVLEPVAPTDLDTQPLVADQLKDLRAMP